VLRSPKLILALLTALNLLNYVDRYVLSAVLEPMRVELGLSSLVAGLLWSIFLIGYTVTSPVFGALGDRRAPDGRGRRGALMAAGVAVWSLATVATGLAQGAAMLVAARALVGVGEASYATLAPTLIDEIAPPGRSTRWMAIFSAAVPIGAALGFIVGGAMYKHLGWRNAFFAVGIPGVIAAFSCLFIAEPVRPSRRDAGPGAHVFRDLADLASVPLYRGTTLGYCAYTFALGGFAFWAPTYLHVRYQMEVGASAQSFGAVTVVGGAVGTLLGGWAADRLARRWVPAGADARTADEVTARTNVLVCSVASALAAPLVGAAIAAHSPKVFLALALPCQIALFSANGPINIAILRSAPPHVRASAMAVAIFTIHALGDGISPPLIGLLRDRSSIQLAMSALPVVFALAAFVWGGAVRASGWLTEGVRVR
jgi:MFS family permease